MATVTLWCAHCKRQHKVCESLAQEVVRLNRVSERRYLIARCPDCRMGPILCRERSPRHEQGICVHAQCVGCGFEGSVPICDGPDAVTGQGKGRP